MTSPFLSASVGVTGLTGRGAGLARSLARHGLSVAVHDPTVPRMTALADRYAAEGTFVGAQSLAELVAAVAQPRLVLVTVGAGAPTDVLLDELAPLLETGDVVVDAADAHFQDTIRREKALGVRGLVLVGAGVSGGADEALRGPSITVGGPDAAYERIGPVLEPVADRVEDRACCAHVGSGASGHFAWMVRQAVATVHDALLNEGDSLARSLTAEPRETVAAEPSEPSEPGSPGAQDDADPGAAAGTQAGWALQSSASLGAPLTGLPEALLARRGGTGAASQAARTALGRRTERRSRTDLTVEEVRAAVDTATLVAATQGFDLVRAGSEAHGWGVDLAAVAAAWRGGSQAVGAAARAQAAYGEQPGLVTLLAAPTVADEVARRLDAWRHVVTAAVKAGVPAPVTTALLSHVDGLVRGTD